MSRHNPLIKSILLRGSQAWADAYIADTYTRSLKSVNADYVRLYGTTSRNSSQASQLPQSIDLLERYRGLVALGRIEYDEEQIRVIMQLRRLQRELYDYAPPAIPSQYLENMRNTSDVNLRPWWTRETDAEVLDATPEHQALVRIRSHAEEIAELTTPKGLLLIGPPGSGKSFLIDLWYAAIPTPFKARKHYNELVLEIYRAVWEETRHRMASVHLADPAPQEPSPVTWDRSIRERWRELLRSGSLPTRWVRKTGGMFSFGPTVQPTIAFTVAQRLILRHWLLVFDEIQLLDVSSATLLADVLSWFWRMGGVIVGSSNKVPDDLYKNGVQRDRLEPFVEALKARCPVLIMRSERDWRVTRANSGVAKTWFTYGQKQDFDDQVSVLLDQASPSSTNLVVFGRPLHVPWSADGVCKFTFNELCDESLGPADYMTLASTFHTIVITSIPVLHLSAKNQARRFISLVDALYEARCRLVCLAEAEPENLFFPDAPVSDVDGAPGTRQSLDVDMMMAEAVAETQDVYRPNVSSYDTPNMAEAPQAPASPLALDTLSIFSGKDEQFAFKRALSRLLEMTSESYAKEEPWAPLPLSSRKWEGSAHLPDSPHYQRSLHWAQSRGSADQETADFASEAANEEHAPPGGRPEAPRLSEAHVWGVREDWGERAKDWGHGAKVYEKGTPASNRNRGQGRE